MVAISELFKDFKISSKERLITSAIINKIFNNMKFMRVSLTSDDQILYFAYYNYLLLILAVSYEILSDQLKNHMLNTN